MTPRFLRRFVILWVSVLIAFIWSLQFMVSIPFFALAQGITRSWPLMDYPMYSEPHFEGDEIARMAVVGIRDDGEEIDIRPEDIGGGYWYFQVFARAVTRADEAVIRDIVRAYEARYNIHLTALRVENRPLLWKSTQVNAAPVEVLRTYPLTAAQRNPTLL
jgi:hypothetical protein